jgi:hypothetical protein
VLIACDADVAATGAGGAGAGSGGAASTSTSSSGGSGVTVGSGAGGGAPVDTYSVSIGPFDVSPGEEQTMCVIVDAGNDAAGMLRTIRTHLTEGSHHLIVTKIDQGSEQPDPQPCSAFAHGGDALFIAEKPEMTLTYPDGAGLPFQSHQLVGIEMHFINYQTGNLMIEGVVDFDLAPNDGSMKEVHLLFDGNTSIAIPPQGQQSIESDHSLPAGAEMFALTSHTHQLGVYASIHKTGPGGDELIHESDDWAEPPFDVFDPAMTFAPGEGLHLRCDFVNPTDQTVNFGTSFYDEMCFLWAHYTLP